MVEYKPGDLSKFLQTAGSELPQSDGSLFNRRKTSPVKVPDPVAEGTASNAGSPDDKKKKKKKKKHREKSDSINEENQSKETKSSSSPGDAEPEKKKKKKQKKIDRVKSMGHQPGFNPPPGIVHESIAAQQGSIGTKERSPKKRKIEDTDTDEEVTTPKKSKQSQDKTRPRRDRLSKKTENRTIFVGNLPISVKKKHLIKMFKEFGEIETVRYRCLPVNDPTVPKRVIAIKEEFHPDRHNCVAYVCFKEEDSAQKALSQNGVEVDGLHIRVDTAGKKDKSDMKESVFVGNLPYNIEEEELRTHFVDCGTVENVRLIRDKKTCIGKGFGFVKFTDKDAVSFATKLNESILKKRKIRVMPCSSKPKKPKIAGKNKAFNDTKKNFVKQTPRPKGKQMSSKQDSSDKTSHIKFNDDDTDSKQKQAAIVTAKHKPGGKFKDRPDKQLKKKNRKRDGKPKKKSFRPSNMRKTPFTGKQIRKESKKQKQTKAKS